MTTLGITGHQSLADAGTWDWVDQELECMLSAAEEPLVGVSCLAVGADQHFARLILATGGSLIAIIPFSEYETRFTDAVARIEYERLKSRAGRVEVLPRLESDEEAYLAAGKRVVELSDLLIAVWNGEPAKGLGGTADVVGHARAGGTPVIHINPSTQDVQRS